MTIILHSKALNLSFLLLLVSLKLMIPINSRIPIEVLPMLSMLCQIELILLQAIPLFHLLKNRKVLPKIIFYLTDQTIDSVRSLKVFTVESYDQIQHSNQKSNKWKKNKHNSCNLTWTCYNNRMQHQLKDKLSTVSPN